MTAPPSRQYPDEVVARVLTRWHLDGDCWISDYSTTRDGYAQIGWRHSSGRTMTTAHRIAWWSKHRMDIPPGMVVDHVCRARRCVNPDHLRLLTNADNAADTRPERWRKFVPEEGRTCRLGHQIVRMANGRTSCPECRNARQRATRAKLRRSA